MTKSVRELYSANPRRIWINLLFFFILTTIVAMNIFAYHHLKKFIQANAWVLHTYKVMEATNKLFSYHLESVVLSRGFLLTGNKLFLTYLNEDIALMNDSWHRLKKLTVDNTVQQQKINKLRILLNERTQLLKQAIKLRSDNEAAELQALIFTGQNLTDRIQNLIDSLYEYEYLLLKQRDVASVSNLNRMLDSIILVNLLSFLFLIAIIFLVNKKFAEHKKLESLRKSSETLLKGIIDGTKDFVAAIDPNFKYIAINEPFSHEFNRLYGLTPTIGMTVEQSLKSYPSELTYILELWERALEGQEFTITNQFGNPKGVRDDYDITYNAIHDNNDVVIGAALIARNITERVNQEMDVINAKKKIEASYGELKQYTEEITLINEMSAYLQTSACLEESLMMIKAYCERMLPTVRGSLYILNASRNYLEQAITWNLKSNTKEIVGPEDCWGLRQGKIYLHYNDSKQFPCKHVKEQDLIYPYICVPLLAQNRTIGLIYLQFEQMAGCSDNEQFRTIDSSLKFIENITAHISLAINNIQLRDALRTSSLRDHLTGLYNRLYLDESLPRDIDRADREGVQLALVMIDFDHFKEINDIYSHEAGDMALKQVAEQLQANTRKSDIACRFGGDEFLIMFYGTDANAAFKKCQILLDTVSNLKLYFRNSQLPSLSLSIGIAMFPEDGDQESVLLSAADKALYSSKKTGRHKITLYSDIQK